MVIQEIINKKRLNQPLSNEEIEFFVKGVAEDLFQDYEISALLMAIAINGMNDRETTTLTLSMMNTGSIVDLSDIDGVKADKHSTGGISDTTTIAAVPILASLGVKMAKMSGRSLGFTGGTADKLEAIDGYNTEISKERFVELVKTIGASMITQTDNIAIADKKLYAMRDVTSTIESIPLIASSIMSKKLASGADIILLDVKFGKGAFMKTKKDAEKLARTMVTIGKNAGKKMCALITSMEEPLGAGIGCTMEIRDAVEVLKGVDTPLSIVTKKICAEILMLAENIDYAMAMERVNQSISSGKALDKLVEIVKAQGGNEKQVLDTSLLKNAKHNIELKAGKSGKIVAIDGESLGNACRLLGGGRLSKGDTILHEVGIDMKARIGDKVSVGDTLAVIHYNNKDIGDVVDKVSNAFDIKPKLFVKKPKLIYKVIK